MSGTRLRRWRGRVTFDFHTGDVEVCCFQEDFACLAAPADAPRVCGVLGYTLYPAKGCCITLKQLYPERPEIVLKQNNTVLCAGCVGVGEKTLWSQAIYCRPPATFLFVELRCCCLAHDFGLNIAGDGDFPIAAIFVWIFSGAPRRQRGPNSTAPCDGVRLLGVHVHAKKGCCVKVTMRSRARCQRTRTSRRMNPQIPPASIEAGARVAAGVARDGARMRIPARRWAVLTQWKHTGRHVSKIRSESVTTAPPSLP